MYRNIEKEAGTKKPLETRTLSNGVIIEDIEKGKLDGKSAVKGKKVSIFDILSTSSTRAILMLSQFSAPLGWKSLNDWCFFQVSILYTGKLKDTGNLFDSNLGEDPLRFRLGKDFIDIVESSL